MFKLSFSVLFLFILGQISAQSISGRIIDNESKEPVFRVLVSVFDDENKSAIASGRTDEKGNFSFPFKTNKKSGDLTIKTKMMGYKDHMVNINYSELGNINARTIELTKNPNQLKEVDIETTRSRAVVKGDTVEYDAKAFKTHKDANVEDLVTKMPGITKEGGEVKAYGEKVQKVLVDGQEFFGEDANIALKNLPAETVDKVEIYDAMGDRNSFTGFNDGNTTKTMNLKTKPGKNKGTFGKAYAGYGTSDRYQLGGNYNYYNGTKRIAILGMANNINNLNFSTSELVGAMTGSSSMGMGGAQMQRGMSFGMGVSSGGGRRSGGFGGPMSNFTISNQDGVNDAYSFGMNYNDIWGKNKKLRTTMSYFGNRVDNFAFTEMKRSNFLDSITTLNTNQNDESRSTQFKHRFSTRLEGELDSKNSFVWTNKLEFNDNNTKDQSIVTNAFNEGVSNLTNNNNSSSLSLATTFNTNFLYKLKLNKSGRTFSVNSIFDISNTDGTSTQNTINTRGTTTNEFGLNYETKQWSSTVTNILTYTEPSGKHGQWLINYSPSLSNRINDRMVGFFNSTNTNPTPVDSLSNRFSNNLFYNVGGVSYRLQYTKWRIMFGSNVQNISFEGIQQFPSSSNLKRDFFGVLPYFNIQFSPSKMTKNRLQYNTSMNVPSLSYIQPVVDLSNPTSIFKGNENLKNEYSHNMFFHYMKPDIVKGTFFIVLSNISYTNDKFSNFTYTAINDTVIDDVSLRKGVTYNKYVNMDNAFTGFAFVNYTMPLPIKKIKSNLSMNGNYTYSQNPSMINGLENMTRTSMYSLGTMISSNMSENIDYSISYNPKYLTNTFSIDGIGANNYWMHTVGANYKITIKKDFVWSSDFSYNYNSNIDPSINQHVFLLGSSIAYKFLKNKKKDNLLEAKLTIFDIFNQNRNITRSVTNTSITDSRTNAMNRYGLFTLTYNFKNFEGRDPDKNGGGFMKMMHGANKD